MLFKQEDLGGVIVSEDYTETLIYPEVGKTYNVFNDGKIRESRLEQWKIIEEINLDKDKVDKELLDAIKTEVMTCYWLYSPEQTLIYKAERIYSEPRDHKEYNYFLATKQNGWFSIGFLDAGLLDIDGSCYDNLMKELMKHFEEV